MTGPSPTVRRATEADRLRLAEFAVALQARPDRHIAYLATEAETIAAEMIEEDDDWTAVSAVAEVPGSAGAELVGWLMGSIDLDMGRTWWFGPFVDADADFAAVANALYAHATMLLPAAVTEEEMAIDTAFDLARDWAAPHGFVAEEGSLALNLDHQIAPSSVPVRPVTPDDVATVAPLHDDLFPGTHIVGERLVLGADELHPRLVVERDGELLGYVAVEVQPDGIGYVDFLGVVPSARGQGLGAGLVRAGVAALHELGCTRVHLTVRAGNVAARSLYAGLGFAEDRVIVPLRKGFSLA